VTGSVYALLAIAIVTVFKTTDVPNFSQGEIFMAGGYVALMGLLVFKLSYALVIPLTLAVMAGVGALFQRFVMERVTGSRGCGRAAGDRHAGVGLPAEGPGAPDRAG
jgi:branched-chain amino acid transport system permease protein